MVSEQVQALCKNIIDEVGKVFVADNDVILRKILCGFLAGGHILFEDNPGLGKTLLVKVFAKVTGCEWKRIQFTPDLMPSDILGTKSGRATLLLLSLKKAQYLPISFWLMRSTERCPKPSPPCLRPWKSGRFR